MNEPCQACAQPTAGYLLSFEGPQNREALRVWTEGDKFTPYQSIDESMIWVNESVAPELLDYFRAHMDIERIFAVPANADGNVLSGQRLPMDELLRHRDAHWIDGVIAEERIKTVYQPIVRGCGEEVEIAAYEFLSRAVSEDGSLIPPYKMFDAARVRGRLFALDRVCRLQAVRSAGRVEDKLVFVNFIPTAIYTPEHCLQSTLVEAWATGVDPHQIIFEVVETEEITDIEHLENILRFYRKHGFRYALDDVGAGFSTVEMVTRLKPDFVKLDMHYVQGVAEDADKQAVALALLEAARAVGATTLAEGVEAAADWRWLAAAGYELFQGYLFGKPEPEPAQQILREKETSV